MEEYSYQISYEDFLEVELPAYMMAQPTTDEALKGLVTVARFWGAVWKKCLDAGKDINDDFLYPDALELFVRYEDYVKRYMDSNPVFREIDPQLPDWEYMSFVAEREGTTAKDGLVDTLKLQNELEKL